MAFVCLFVLISKKKVIFMARQVNYGVVAGIFVVALLGYLVVSNVNSGDLVGGAIATLSNTGTLTLQNSNTYFDIDSQQPSFDVAFFSGADFRVVKFGHRFTISRYGITTVKYLYSGTSFANADSLCLEPSGYGTSLRLIYPDGIACVKVGNSIMKIQNTGSSNIQYAFIQGYPNVCGDNIVQGTEQCDGGALNGSPN